MVNWYSDTCEGPNDKASASSARNEGFFGTGALPDDVKPDVTFFAITKRSLPPEFTALATDNVGVDRVEFYCDGEYVETDYSTPYQFYLDPAYMGMTRAEYFTDHTIEARAFDRGGMICVAATAFTPYISCDPPTEWFFRMPYDGYMVSTNGDVAEDGTTIDIIVDASTTEWTYGQVPGHPEIETVQGTAVDRMEFWVDGTRVYNSDADITYHSYDWDASGISLGDHTVLVKAFYDDCVYSESHTFRVVRPMPDIEVSRTVHRNDNFFTVSVCIENSAEDINEVAIIDNFIYNSIDHGLQVIDENGYSLVLNSYYSTRDKHCENEITLESPSYRLWPGESMGITYSAVPILYTGDAVYGLSEVTIEIDYHDAYGNPHNETFFLPAEDGDHFASLVDDATSGSDYLIVTNPARLFSHYTDADVEALLSSMAGLAEGKNGVLGYLDTHSQSAFKDLIEPGGDWSSRLATDWTSEGYLLLVGETEIIGSWNIPFGGTYGTVHYTDLPYANTAGEWKDPELIVGRIIGNDASELIIPIQTSINVYKGEPGFEWDRSHALAVSGGGKGANAFERNVDDVADILDDEFSVRKLKQRATGDAGGDIATEFKTHDANRDVIFFRDHGWPTEWSDVVGTGDFVGANPVDFEDSKPFAFACCCWAGRYEGEDIDDDGSYEGESGIAERFLQHGTAVYIGSTEVSQRYRNNVAAKKFFEEWVGSSYSIGRAFRDFKNDFNSCKGRRYWIAEYNLYGDPKYGSASTVAGAASTPKMAASEPQRSLEIVIPDYNVTTTEEYEHYVEIPGGDTILELDKPMVPFYTADLDYPVGCRVQDVILTDRSGMTTETGLNIPDETMEWDSTTIGVLSSSRLEEWWPEEVFEWNVRENPDGTSTLIIVMYPFYYNPLTTDVEFYRNYKFEINYISSTVEIAALRTDKDVYQQGDDVLVSLWLNNSGDDQDVLVDAVVKAGGSGEVVDGLLLRTLKGFEGIASFSPQWDSNGIDPGYYFVEVTLKDTGGDVLDRKTEMFRLGISSGEIASFTATPEFFDIGDEIEIEMAFKNNGTVDITGTAVIRVLNSTGHATEEFRHNVTNLTPSESISFSDIWDTSGAEAGSSYTIIGYVLYDSRSTDPATVTVRNMIMGDLNRDGEITTADAGIALELAASGEYDPAADVNCDGQITSLDALMILHSAAGARMW